MVAYRSRDQVLTLLRDLAPLRARLRVTVFDNDSRDGTPAAVRSAYPWARLVESPVNLGYAGALRAALPSLSGEALWWLNADLRLEADTFERLSAALARDPWAGAVGPALLDPDGRPAQGGGGADLSLKSAALHFGGLARLGQAVGARGLASSGLYLPRGFGCGRGPFAVDWVAGTAPLLRREALERAGGVPPSPFLYGEDLLLSRALRRAGYRVLYHPGARVVHQGRGSQGPPDGRWVEGTLASAPPRLRRPLALWFGLGLGARLAAAAALRSPPERRAALRAGYRAGCRALLEAP